MGTCSSNRLLLGGILFELVFATAIVYLAPLARVFGAAPPSSEALLLLIPFPFVVWGVDEFFRAAVRRRGNATSP